MRIAVPDLISNSYFPAVAAVELGLFKAEGVDADLELHFPVTKAMEAMRDGQFDFVAGSAHSTLTAFTDWQGAKLLCALAQKTYWFLILRTDLGVKRGDLAALRGLRIGAAPGVDLALRYMLIEAGLDPEQNDIAIGPVQSANAAGVSFGVTAARALEEGSLDGFWANGMGAEVAVRRGIGTVALDARRDASPPKVGGYTFPALVTTDALIARDPDLAAAATRAIIAAQKALREDPSRATRAVENIFPPEETQLIATLIERDLPYYDPAITPETVEAMNRFAQGMGILSHPVPYDQVVAPQFRHLWAS
jgi:ABC-type nitrate/sulfonate/bicarbonate transport system substrate-binding protein